MTELPVVYGESALTITRLLDWEEAVQLSHTLTRITKATAWFWGDFLNMAEKTWPQTWTQLIPEDLSPSSLRNYAWVSSRFNVNVRDPAVPWSIYQICAGVDSEVDRLGLIGKAKDEGLTCAQVRDLVRPQKDKAIKPIVCPSCGYTWA